VRDRALILLGFAGAFRRSELVGLDIEDCAFGKDGLTVTLRRSKTDQTGEGRRIGIPYGSNPETCHVRNLQDWTEQGAITGGPLCWSINRHGKVQEGRLSGIDVARVVKKLAKWPVWMPASTRAIPSAPGTPRQRQSPVRRSGPSCAKLGIGLFRWCGGISETGVCSGRIAQGSSGSNLGNQSAMVTVFLITSMRSAPSSHSIHTLVGGDSGRPLYSKQVTS
jgi:hypothetical protein